MEHEDKQQTGGGLCKFDAMVRCLTPLCGREATAYVLRHGDPKCDICIERNYHVIKRRIKTPNTPHHGEGAEQPIA